MVIAISICLAVLGSVAMLCFKGITVKYNKTFTIEDNRLKHTLTENEVKRLESKLNTNEDTKTVDKQLTYGPMDTVIQEIHDLFGPESNDDDGGIK